MSVAQALTRTIAALALGAGVIVGAAPACAQAPFVRDRIYPAPREPLSLDDASPSSTFATVQTSDGLTLRGLAAPGDDRPMLLVLHGNASSARGALDWLRPAIDEGYGVVAAEYRGYSANPGTPDEPGLAKDADAFLAYARALAKTRPLWLVGHSLGGGVAMSLAERDSPDVLITVGTFTRLRDMVSGPARAVVPDAYRNIDRARTVSVPWYLVHGLRDDTVPAVQGQTLHGVASEARRQGASLVIPEADHRPDGATLLAVLEAIRTRAMQAPPSPGSLPAGVLVIPFGQSAPLTAP